MPLLKHRTAINRHFIALGHIVLLCGLVNGQGTWTQKASLPASPRYDGIGFSIGNYGYVGVGNNGSTYIMDFWQYDPNSNSWTPKANFPGGTSYQSVAFSIGLKGYIVAGIGGNNVWEYDSSNDSWTQVANLPGSNRNAGIGFSIGTKGYAGAGYSGSPSIWYKDFWEYDPALNTWTQKANYSGQGRGYSFSISVGAKGYVGTGRDSTMGYFNDFWEYNPSLNLWTQKPNFPGGARADIDGGRFTINGRIYAGTGTPGVGFSSDFWKYDTLLNQWSQILSFPIARMGACGFSISNKGYISTGLTASSNCFNDLWEYCDTCVEVTGSDVNNKNLLRIFPNPFSKQTCLMTTVPLNNATLFVDNCFGQTVVQIKNISGQTITLHRNNLPIGTYFLRLTQDNKLLAANKLIILDN